MTEEVSPQRSTKDSVTARLLEELKEDSEFRRLNEPKLAQLKFHVVVIPDAGKEQTATFNTVEDLVIFLRSLDTHASIRIYEGIRWHISKGSPKQLCSPDGKTFEIYHRDTEIDDDGRLDSYDSSRVMDRLLKPSPNGSRLKEGAVSDESN